MRSWGSIADGMCCRCACTVSIRIRCSSNTGNDVSTYTYGAIKLKRIVSSNDEETSAKMLGIGGEYSGARRLGVA